LKQVDFWQTKFNPVFAGRRVLVTGATGFVGGHLCRALIELGAEVHGLARRASESTLVPGCQPWAVDLMDALAVQQALSEAQPHLVYHLAGLVTAHQDASLVLPMLQNNLLGAINLLLAATKTECDRLILVGSSEEPAAGATDPTPTSPYAAAKAATSLYAQMFHRVYGVPIVGVKPFVIYGSHQDVTKFIPYTILSLLREEAPRLSSGKRVVDLVYIVDIVRGLLQVGIQPGLEGKVMDLGTGQGTCLRDVVELLVELSNSQVTPLFGAVADRLGEHPQIADRDITRQLLDWEPLWSLRQGLTETIGWYRSQQEDSRGKR